MNIHTKLILNYMGIVLVILLAMYGYLDYSLKQNLSERITDELTVQAKGLGLAIAKHILLQHGGRIWVDSSPGEGSIFHFVLPLQRRISATEQIVQHSQIDDDRTFESRKNL